MGSVEALSLRLSVPAARWRSLPVMRRGSHPCSPRRHSSGSMPVASGARRCALAASRRGRQAPGGPGPAPDSCGDGRRYRHRDARPGSHPNHDRRPSDVFKSSGVFRPLLIAVVFGLAAGAGRMGTKVIVAVLVMERAAAAGLPAIARPIERRQAPDANGARLHRAGAGANRGLAGWAATSMLLRRTCHTRTTIISGPSGRGSGPNRPRPHACSAISTMRRNCGPFSYGSRPIRNSGIVRIWPRQLARDHTPSPSNDRVRGYRQQPFPAAAGSLCGVQPRVSRADRASRPLRVAAGPVCRCACLDANGAERQSRSRSPMAPTVPLTLSIVVPAFNEERRLAATLATLCE